MFFINSILNFQAFIENKQIISIKELKLEIKKYNLNDNYITGDLKIDGIAYHNTLDNEVIINDELSFNMEIKDNNVSDIKIADFNYQIIEGRGLELELDFEVLHEESTNRSIKEEIVENIDDKLDEIFYEDENKVIEEKEEKRILLTKNSFSSKENKSRKTFKFQSFTNERI